MPTCYKCISSHSDHSDAVTYRSWGRRWESWQSCWGVGSPLWPRWASLSSPAPTTPGTWYQTTGRWSSCPSLTGQVHMHHMLIWTTLWRVTHKSKYAFRLNSYCCSACWGCWCFGAAGRLSGSPLHVVWLHLKPWCWRWRCSSSSWFQ